MKKLVILFLFATLLTACGVKGPLFQPSPDNSHSVNK